MCLFPVHALFLADINYGEYSTDAPVTIFDVGDWLFDLLDDSKCPLICSSGLRLPSQHVDLPFNPLPLQMFVTQTPALMVARAKRRLRQSLSVCVWNPTLAKGVRKVRKSTEKGFRYFDREGTACSLMDQMYFQ